MSLRFVELAEFVAVLAEAVVEPVAFAAVLVRSLELQPVPELAEVVVELAEAAVGPVVTAVGSHFVALVERLAGLVVQLVRLAVIVDFAVVA